MRTLRKRLVCANRDDYQKNRAAMGKVEQRYLNKMAAKGWELFVNANTTSGFAMEGNAFFKWERYITLVKYSESESALRQKNIKESQNV